MQGVVAHDLTLMQIEQLKSKLRPCVSEEQLLNGSEDVLRLRLAALLHVTGLQGGVPVDLRDRHAAQLRDCDLRNVP